MGARSGNSRWPERGRPLRDGTPPCGGTHLSSPWMAGRNAVSPAVTQESFPEVTGRRCVAVAYGEPQCPAFLAKPDQRAASPWRDLRLKVVAGAGFEPAFSRV